MFAGSMRSIPSLLVALALVFLSGCSSDEEQSPEDDGRPPGPAASVVGVLSGGQGIRLAAGNVRPLPNGWVEEEYALEGTAISTSWWRHLTLSERVHG